MNQAVSFGLLLGGGILLVSVFSDKSLADVVKGKGPFTVSSAGVNLASGGVSGVGATITGSTSSTAKTAPAPAGGYTKESFAAALLAAIGAPTSTENINAIVAWENQEGGNWSNSATFNPINTTQPMQGSSVMAGGSSAGVQAYTSWAQGLEATVQTLENGNYPHILSLLRAGEGALIGSSPDMNTWGTGSFNSG